MFIYKLKAFSLHIMASLLLALISLWLVFFVWYPAPLHIATGVTKLVLLVLAILLILGPFLTFIVSKPNKKSLTFDLSVIVILQLSALIYGLYQVYDGRPAWIAYNVDRFDLVRNNEIDTRKLAEARPEYQQVGQSGSGYVAAIVPTDDSELSQQILFDEVGDGIAPSQRPELYQPLAAATPAIIKRAQALSALDAYNNPAHIKTVLAQYPEADSFLALKANAVDMTVLINKKNNGAIVKIVDLRPW